ncbi:MAG: DNA polymerase I, partial [Lachnospiraceae bacterium]|nr:DNA polymerase I [Lachnospiraceae bacterium]
MEKLLLIDGNSIMNRAFYGVPDLTNASGLHTNAVYGFLNIIFRFIDEEKPDYLAIAFDLHAPTFRHKMYEAYKGTRKGMPDELREQVPYIKKLVSCMNIKTMELEGYEADDLLGTMAKKGAAKGMEVSLLSGDRDLLQIADEHIKIRIPKTVRGVTTVEDYYPQDVIEKYKVNPVEFIHLKALMGDSSDNIPGVPKVGAKTAEELIVKYHSLDGIYDSVEEITKASIKQSLIDNKDLAYLCLKLATIETNAPIELPFDEIKYDLRFTKEGYDIIRELNLKSYFKRFEDNMSADVVIEEEDFEYTSIEDFGSYSDFSQKIKDINVFTYIGKEDGDYVSFDGGNYYISKMFSFSSMINDLVANDVCIITEDVNAIYELLDKKAFA